jgi:F0F1-type ATP synthase assembly protein I
MRNGGKGPAGRQDVQDAWGAKYAGAGVQFGAAIVLFTLGGAWLDGKLGTTPLFTLIGLAVGGVSGFMGIYTRVMADVKREDARKEDAPPASGEADQKGSSEEGPG